MPEQVYIRAKTAAEVRYNKALDAARMLRGGAAVREAARRAANDRLALDYQDAETLALFHGNPIVDMAEQALRAFGDDLTREQARRLLMNWRHTGELSPRERQAVLVRFPHELDGPVQVELGEGNSGPGGAL
jgi:hypothetical protein